MIVAGSKRHVDDLEDVARGISKRARSHVTMLPTELWSLILFLCLEESYKGAALLPQVCIFFGEIYKKTDKHRFLRFLRKEGRIMGARHESLLPGYCIAFGYLLVHHVKTGVLSGFELRGGSGFSVKRLQNGFAVRDRGRDFELSWGPSMEMIAELIPRIMNEHGIFDWKDNSDGSNDPSVFIVADGLHRVITEPLLGSLLDWESDIPLTFQFWPQTAVSRLQREDELLDLLHRICGSFRRGLKKLW